MENKSKDIHDVGSVRKWFLGPVRSAWKSVVHIIIHDGSLAGVSALILYLIQLVVGAIESEDMVLFENILWLLVGLIGLQFVMLVVWKPLVIKGTDMIWYAIYQQTLPLICLSDNNKFEKIGSGKMISLYSKGAEIWLFMIIDMAGSGFKSLVFFLIFLGVLFSMGMQIVFRSILGLLGLCLWLYFWHDKQFLLRSQAKDIWTQMGRQKVRWIQNKHEIFQADKVNFELSLKKDYIVQHNILKMKEKFLQGIAFDGIDFFMYLGLACLLFIVGKGISTGSYSYANIVFVVSMGLMSISEINKLMFQIRRWMDQRVDIIKLHDAILDIKPHRDYNRGEKFKIQRGDIVLDNICFGYTDEDIFTDFNVAISSGQVVGLVGPSGGGKSTLLKLIAGFMEPQTGFVNIDGFDREQMNLQFRFKQIGYLSQEPSIFDGTVRENLMYGIQDNALISIESEISVILQKAQCQFVYDLPNGLDTEIGERGVRLSGGQRQRLAIAKIMLKNPKIILLDEPTSALDSVSEELVSHAMQELFIDRTVIIIAHRLQTVKHADRILYIEDGKILEEGTHDELIAMGGKYATMVEVQLGF